jgi:oxygen-independent coproporphyrinogen-3 oxidase
VQDFTPEVQAVINRYQTLEGTQDLFAYCRKNGFDSINVDMIYGLPLQLPETFGRAIDHVIALRPDRVAMYSFAFVPWKQGNQRTMTEDMMLPPEAKVELYLLGLRKFTAAGYRQIGMDHFALPTDELSRAQESRVLHRNFMGYTTQAGRDMVAVGVSGIGDLRGALVQNVKTLTGYYQAIEAGRFPIERGYVLDRDDRIRRYVITELMCRFRLDLPEVSRRYGIDARQYFAQELTDLSGDDSPVADGLVTIDDDIFGRVAYSGGVWFRPDYRGRFLTGILPRISRAFAFSRWYTDVTTTLMAEALVDKGVAARCGYTHIDWDVTLRNTRLGTFRCALLAMRTDQMLDDLGRFLEQIDAQVDGRIEDRAGQQPAAVGDATHR